MRIDWNNKNIQILAFLILISNSCVFCQDFNVFDDVFSVEAEKVKLGNLDANSLSDAVMYDLNSVEIALNIGDDFDAISSTLVYQSANPIQQVEVYDYNGNGIDDILLLEKDYGALILLENDGSGNFNITQLIDECQVRSFKAIDIDGDTRFDIIGTSQGDDFVSQNLVYYKQITEFDFEMSTLHSTEAYFVSDYIISEDIDQDGDLDLLYHELISSFSNGFLQRGEFLLYLQNDDKTFEEKSIKMNDQAMADLEIADMNSDGMLDIVFTTTENQSGYDNVFVAFQENDLVFDFEDISPDQQIFNRDGVAFELIDINLDGSLDVVYELRGIRVALNQGDKSFDHSILIPSTPESDLYTREFEVVDFNNDGLEDILATFNSTGRANAPKEWSWFKMTDREALTFEQQNWSFAEGEDEYNLWQITDLDDDGFMDVIADRGNSFIFENLIIATSSNELFIDDRVNVFPNPSSDYIILDFGDLKITKARIFDSNGMLVQSVEDITKSVQVNIKDLPFGNYYLRMWDSQESIIVEKSFIKVGNN